MGSSASFSRFGQRAYRRSVEGGAINRKLRAMTRTVPAGLERISVQMTADVGTGGGSGVQLPCVIAIGGGFCEASPHDGAMSGLQVVGRGKFAGARYSARFFPQGDVLLQEITDADGVLREGA